MPETEIKIEDYSRETEATQAAILPIEQRSDSFSLPMYPSEKVKAIMKINEEVYGCGAFHFLGSKSW